tara:strand:- start:2620 stop:4065 length:1446 start_codon:yes stop_codon:yes gene_type:complete
MTAGTLLHMGTKGPEDKFLYGNPKMTYFKNVFTKARNFALEFNKIPKSDGKVDFGKTIRMEIPQTGDLLAGIYFDFRLKDLKRTIPYTEKNVVIDPETDTSSLFIDNTLESRWTSYVNGIGYNIIKDVKLFIGGNLIQTLNAELIYLINEVHTEYNKTFSFRHMTKYSTNFSIGNTNNKNVRCHLQLPFYFSKDPGQYIPICALTNSKIEIQITLREFEECLVRDYNTTLEGAIIAGVDGYQFSGNSTIGKGDIPDTNEMYHEDVSGGIEYFDVITQNIYLDKEDQKLFRIAPKLDYMIELYHIGNQEIFHNPVANSTYSVDIECKHPTKYIIWLLQRDDVNKGHIYENYTFDFELRYGDGFYPFDVDSHLLEETDILVNNTAIMDGIDPIFLSKTQIYERFKGSTLNPFYLYNFALNPNSNEPTGTFNLSVYKKKTFQIRLVDEQNYTNNNKKTDILFRYYTSYFNILLISDGMAGLLYN